MYTGHDADGATFFEMPDWQLYSTTDMQNWENHGTILSATDFSCQKLELHGHLNA